MFKLKLNLKGTVVQDVSCRPEREQENLSSQFSPSFRSHDGVFMRAEEQKEQ